jgi:hypothetical protein
MNGVTDRADLDVVASHALASLLSRSHLLQPDAVAAAVIEAAEPLGVQLARIYLADLQQR